MAYRLRTRKRTGGGEGDWQCVHTRPHPSDPTKRVSVSKTFPAKLYGSRTAARKAAEAWGNARDREANIDPTTDPTLGKTTFASVAEQWLATKKRKLQPSSYRRAESIVRTHLTPVFGLRGVGTITFMDWRDHLAKLGGETKPDGTTLYAAGTLNRIHGVMTSVMEEARKRKIITANPVRGAASDVVEPSERKMTCLTPAEVVTLADAITAHYRPMVLAAAYTGLRAGELQAMRRRDVDLIKNRITVVRSIKQWRERKPIYGTTKTGKTRVVKISTRLHDVLADHLATRPLNPDALVFVNERETTVHQTAFYRTHFVPAARSALPHHPDLRWHDLRHTYVSALLGRGVDVLTVAKQAGHASAKMTLDTYGHLLPDSDERVGAALDAAWDSAAESVVVPIRQAS